MSSNRRADVMYSNRRADRVVLNVTIPRDARRYLDELTGDQPGVLGQTVARLVFEHKAREEGRAEERLRMQTIALG